MPSEYPTNDIVVAEAPALRRWLNEKLRDAIWPLLAEEAAGIEIKEVRRYRNHPELKLLL